VATGNTVFFVTLTTSIFSKHRLYLLLFVHTRLKSKVGLIIAHRASSVYILRRLVPTQINLGK
jgi:hypothetical protein